MDGQSIQAAQFLIGIAIVGLALVSFFSTPSI